MNEEVKLNLFPLLLGNGKLSRHLHHYFHLTQFQHKHFDDARNLRNPELVRKLREVNSIWILTSDQSIETVARDLKSQMIAHDLNPDSYTWIHSSAATEIAAPDLPAMHTLHPLMTFSETLYTLEQYQRIPFAVISSQAEKLKTRLPLSNPTLVIPSEKRAFYHASAVMMSNLPIILWSAVTKEFSVNVGQDISVFDPILKQTLANFLELRDRALTGPIARNDQATIQKNLAAIENTPLHKIYSAFIKGESL